jgi:hypothetical protein
MLNTRGFISHAAVGLLAFGAGLAGTYLLRNRSMAAAEHIHEQTTTHGEYVWIKRPPAIRCGPTLRTLSAAKGPQQSS